VNLFLKFIGICILFQFGISCSFLSTSAGNNNYHIDYSSGGGFTGIESGITIDSNGSVRYWERKLNSSPIITDSTELTSVQLNTLNELMKSREIFTYKNDYKGNYTARLTFVNNESNNKFSFNPSEYPKDMPEVIKKIIAEINNIHKHQ
jgi:hypothetical protein